jgi:hypothetical protein
MGWGRDGGRGAGLTVVRRGRAKRKRFVYPPRDVAKVWAKQTQDAARNRTGNIYFYGDTIYSYGPHFPIARLTDVIHRGQRVVLFTTLGYSSTTAGHKSCVRRALEETKLFCIEVPDVDANTGAKHEKNYKALVTEYEHALLKASRAPVCGPYLLSQAERIRRNLNAYRKMFLADHQVMRHIPKRDDHDKAMQNAKQRQVQAQKALSNWREDREFTGRIDRHGSELAALNLSAIGDSHVVS